MAGQVGLLHIGTDEPCLHVSEGMDGVLHTRFGGHTGNACSFVICNNIRHFPNERDRNPGICQNGRGLYIFINPVSQVQALVSLLIGSGCS